MNVLNVVVAGQSVRFAVESGCRPTCMLISAPVFIEGHAERRSNTPITFAASSRQDDVVERIFVLLLFVEVGDERGELPGWWLRCHRWGMRLWKDEDAFTPTRYVLMRRLLLLLKQLFDQRVRCCGIRFEFDEGG